MLKKFFTFLLLFTLYIFAEDFDTAFSMGLKPDSYDLMSSIKEANPNHKQLRGLPEEIDLSPFMPPVGEQGKQASCVAWSTAYAYKSYTEYIEHKDDKDWKLKSGNVPNYKNIFSPSYVYNQINGGKDTGASISEAMSLIVSKGAVPWENMPYEVSNYTKQPTQDLLELGMKYRAKEFQKLRYNNPDEIKAQLAVGRPVVAGILIHSNFRSLKGKTVYNSATGASLGGHSVTIVGYDDSQKVFKVMNSWGPGWGENGYGYIDYKWFSKICRSAFVLIDTNENRTKLEMAALEGSGQKPKGEPNKAKLLPPQEINASKGNHSDKIVLSWSNSVGAIGYEIYRGFPDEDSYQLAGLSHNTNFDDTGIDPDVAYTYKIAAVSENEVSEKSEGYAIGYATKAKNEVPAKPSGLKASDGIYKDKIILEWQPLANVTGYQIFKWDNKVKTYRSLGKTIEPRFEDRTAAKNGAVENYTVAGLKNAITGILSESVIGRTAISSRLPPPENITASTGQFTDKVELKWGKVEGAIGYMVYRYDDSSWTPLEFVSTTEYFDSSPGKGKKFYTVIAKNKDNVWGSYSEYALGYIDPNTKRSGNRLEAPKYLSAVLSQDSDEVLLSWNKVENSDEYNLWFKKPGEKKWGSLSKVEGTKISFTTKLPEKNSFFLYAVTSKTSSGPDSEYSQSVSIVSSTVKKAPTRRTFGATSKAEKLSGTWSAMQWDGMSGVKNIVMEIENKGDNEVTIKIDNKKTYMIKYPAESPEIEIEGKLRLRISSDDALLVELKDKSISKDKLELSFLRE